METTAHLDYHQLDYHQLALMVVNGQRFQEMDGFQVENVIYQPLAIAPNDDGCPVIQPARAYVGNGKTVEQILRLYFGFSQKKIEEIIDDLKDHLVGHPLFVSSIAGEIGTIVSCGVWHKQLMSSKGAYKKVRLYCVTLQDLPSEMLAN